MTYTRIAIGKDQRGTKWVTFLLAPYSRWESGNNLCKGGVVASNHYNTSSDFRHFYTLNYHEYDSEPDKLKYAPSPDEIAEAARLAGWLPVAEAQLARALEDARDAQDAAAEYDEGWHPVAERP